MKRIGLVAMNLVAASAAMSLLQCGDDDAATPTTPDASTSSSSSSGSVPAEAGFEDVIDPDVSFPVPTPRKWRPTVVTVNLQPQPMPTDAGAIDPGFTVPLVLPTNESFTPKRAPDVYVDSKFAGGIGLGCIAYKFSPANPVDPKGPGLTHGDMGTVTVTGHSGTGKYLFPPAAGSAIADPITCTRSEKVPPDPDAGDGGFAGIHDYACNTFGPVGPGDDGGAAFLSKNDTLTVAAAGGADLPAWTVKVKPSPNDNLVVKTNLYGLQASDVDGSKDLKLEYECGGAPCGMAAAIFVNIVSSNARSGPPSNPWAFPGDVPTDPFPTEFGVISCLDLLSFNGKEYTVPKEVLAQIPGTWNDLRVVVATTNSNFGQVQAQPTTAAAGFARFGISRR